MELVTEPDIHNAEEAVAFLEHMRSIYQYAGISEADSKKGQIRCDVNVSLMEEDATELGTKVSATDIVLVDGKKIALEENKRYVLRIMPSVEARSKNFLVIHSMRSTVLAITIGLELHIPLSKLIELGYAYESNGDVFFRVNKVPGYGRLSNLNLDELPFFSALAFACSICSFFSFTSVLRVFISLLHLSTALWASFCRLIKSSFVNTICCTSYNFCVLEKNRSTDQR